MRHHNKNRKFGREKDVRAALLRSLSLSLILKEKIKTTEAKAKELRPIVEKLVTKARKGDLASRRLVISRIGSKVGAKKLFDEIAIRYKDRQGGYTRIVKLPSRSSDAAKMAIIEFI